MYRKLSCQRNPYFQVVTLTSFFKLFSKIDYSIKRWH